MSDMLILILALTVVGLVFFIGIENHRMIESSCIELKFTEEKE